MQKKKMKFDVLYNSYLISAYFNHWELLPTKTLAYFVCRCPDSTNKIFLTIEEAMQFANGMIPDEF